MRALLLALRAALDAAVERFYDDPEAALDDVLAARLLATTALMRHDERSRAQPEVT